MVHVLFDISVISKGVDGALEIVDGALLYFVSPAHIHSRVVYLSRAGNSVASTSGTIPSFHHRVRGLCHGIAPVFLPAGAAGTPVALRHAAFCLATRAYGRGSEAIHAAAAAVQALQRPAAVAWPHPHAPLYCLCAGPRARPPTARWPATPHGPPARTTAPGGHLAACLPASGRCLAGLGGTGEAQCQWPSHRWTVAPAVLHGLWGLFPRAPWHAIAGHARGARAAGVGGGRVGGRVGYAGRGPRV